MISISSVSWLCIFLTLALRVKTYPAGWILYTWMSVSWYLIRTAIKPNFNCMNVKCLIHNFKHHVCGLTSILTFPEKSGQETSWEYQIQPKQRSVYPNLMDPEILSDSSPTQMWWTTWTFYWCVCVRVCYQSLFMQVLWKYSCQSVHSVYFHLYIWLLAALSTWYIWLYELVELFPHICWQATDALQTWWTHSLWDSSGIKNFCSGFDLTIHFGSHF